MSSEIYVRLVNAGAPELPHRWHYVVEPMVDPDYTPSTEFFFVSIVDSSGRTLSSKIRSCGTAIDENGVQANLVRTCGEVFYEAQRTANATAARSLWTGSHP